ncbi:MAG TPA: glycoside hydrolase, partial [Phycisphaerae bacterium]|nr:glycoside hydrolase [Phycisphaerae bacterium]
MAPGGGVTGGYQLVFRAKNLLGPYESRIVLEQGATKVNGPHQGGWVTTGNADVSSASSRDWFIHFQEILPYGRILHLQPVKWDNDWPVMGDAPAGAEKGQPISTYKIPVALQSKIENQNSKIVAPQSSDEFNTKILAPQWQWWANFDPAWANQTVRPGWLRLTPVSLAKETPLYNRPNLLLQKFPAETFTATTRLDLSALADGETAGLVLAGKTMASLTCSRVPSGIKIVRTSFNANNRNTTDEELETDLITDNGVIIDLLLHVAPKGVCTFEYRIGKTIRRGIGGPITAINDTWIGAKVGLFCNAPPGAKPQGHADFDFLHFESNPPKP